MAVNQFADLTHDEFMALQTLKVKDLPKTAPLSCQMKAPSLANEVDWRDKVKLSSLNPISKLKYIVIFGQIKMKEQTKEP